MVAHTSNISVEKLVKQCWVLSLKRICQIPAYMEPDAGPLCSFWHSGIDGKGKTQTQEKENVLIFYLMAVSAFSVCSIWCADPLRLWLAHLSPLTSIAASQTWALWREALGTNIRAQRLWSQPTTKVSSGLKVWEEHH